MTGDRPSDPVDRAYRVGDAVLDAPPVADQGRLIRALAIVQIVLGALSGCGFLMMVSIMVSAGGGPAKIALIYGIPSANLLVTGIGSVRIAAWAWWATLISAFIWLALSAVILAFGGSRGMTYEMWLASAVLIVGIALAILVIVVYTRPSVRATFARRQAS
jgi:hypothetical protein